MAKPKQDDKAQSKRFIEKARELKADESGKKFERAFKTAVPPKPGSGKSSTDADGRESGRNGDLP